MSNPESAQPLNATEKLLLAVGDAIYVRIAPLAITAWCTTEPVTFGQRTTGEQHSVAVGRPWGKRLFDCSWMRFNATLPADAPAALVARIDVNGELCLVDADGVPVRGLTNVKSTFDERLGGPAKTIYELPARAAHDREIEFWGDAGFNDLFGFLKDGGAVALAEIALRRDDVRQLYYDLETLRDYQAGLPPHSPLSLRLDADVHALAADLDCASPAWVASARARLRPWFHSADKDRLQVHAVGHAHLDLAWLWPLRETIRKGARTFASALYNIARYPEYVFGCSQPQLFAWMKEHHPSLYSKIKDAVRAGRIEPQGTFWVEPDCNMPSGESFVRQVLLGARFFREEFGVVPAYCWQPDVFGYNGQLPQILRKSGHAFFMTQKLSWNIVNRFPHQSFRWEGIDGTSILTHMLPEETYNSPAAARSLRMIADNYAQRDVSGHALMVFGIGDGGGGPDAEHLERLRRAPGLPELPAVKIQPAARFFETWAADADRFPIWKGELYLERHQGTLTTQAKTKRHNRRCEVALREVEWAAYLAATLAGVPYPTEALDRLWKEVLLYQFHDILPGSSIKRVYDECSERYEHILAELAALQHERYVAVASRIAPAGVHVAFNSLSWPRTEWIKTADTWARVSIPAFGCTDLSSASVPLRPFPELRATATLLENDRLRVTLAADGRISSLHDKLASREILAAAEFANDFVVIPDTGDAWDFEADHAKKDVRGYLRQPVRRPVLHQSRATLDGPAAELHQVWLIGDSEIRQTLRLLAGENSLRFETTVDWHEPAHMLRVRFPVAIQADEARFEIPFGSLLRSTRDDTSHHQAQLEVAALQWIDLSQADYGVALFNDCKYGFRVKGHVLDMSLIRSVPHPGAPLIGKDDQPDRSTAAVFGDLGAHTFNYVLHPHAGPVDLAGLTAAARALNTPLAIVTSPGSSPSAPPSPAIAAIPPLTLIAPEIELAAIKPASDGHGWILRLVNLTDAPVTASFSSTHADHWRECDLVEQPLPGTAPAAFEATPAIIAFHPHEIKTLRLG